MKIEIKKSEDDDIDFIAALPKMIKIMVETHKPDELFIIRINNWFDHKWLGFAGKQQVHLESGLPEIDREVVPKWKSKSEVTIPPFSPNRVIYQLSFQIKNNVIIPHPDQSKNVHKMNKRQSSLNLENRLLDFSPCGSFVWFSSKSSINKRATIQVYHTEDEKVYGWYASFEKDKRWKTVKSKNKRKPAIDSLLRQSNINST